MQPSFDNETEYLAKAFGNISATGQELCNIEFEGCHFHDCNFAETIFKKCRFIECTFTRCNLSVMKVPQSQFADVVFDECKMVGVDWTRASWPRLVFSVCIKFSKCIINDSSFFGLHLDEIAIADSKAHDVDFRDGSFCRAVFTCTDFTNSLFGKTNLSGADFSEATNYDIDIFNNKTSKAKFSRHEAIRLLNSLDIELVD
jgi:fluoroquinolone resistance protein